MQPADLARNWVGAFNRADVSALTAMYTEDAVNHQVANEAIHGRESIRQMFQQEFGTAQRGYWDTPSFLRMHRLPIPQE